MAFACGRGGTCCMSEGRADVRSRSEAIVKGIERHLIDGKG